ncbi:alpha/beta hydrolase family protein [Demequina flava]|uniref:alpha/beta hydrolase family protein n=1 Tax=Demequina flava TaxID=1095025 RepID=UPI000A659DD3|nr:CocE/NonD family hydrolase [Demequina flava]
MSTPVLRRNGFWFAVALIICLVSAIGAATVQSDRGNVDIKDMQWETSSGRMLNALLFRPDTATADTPAPAVVVSHGWWNNREMQDANYTELARRGYVVVSIDMYGHGNSDPLPSEEIAVNGTGMYDAVQLVADLPYVDTERIGVEGHSNGARAANFSIGIDNTVETPLIAAAFLVDNEAFYTDSANDNAYFNYYGSRDVGLVADQYDEFFFRSYSPEGEALTPPRDFATTPNAQSFLHFGADPSTFDDVREPGEYYSQDVDGEEAVRVLYTPNEIHPWSTVSATTVGSMLEFFETTLGAPDTIAPDDQVWQTKEFFNALGLIGFGMFLVTFTKVLLRTPFFATLRVKEVKKAVALDKAGHGWFWGGLVFLAIVSAWSYVWLSNREGLSGTVFNAAPSFWPQGAVFFIALWAAINGVVALALMTVIYLVRVRKQGTSLRDLGVLPGWGAAGKTILLGIATTAAAFTVVFIVDYFFKTDFRYWVLAVKWFPADKIGYALYVIPLFLIYFIGNSIAVNAFSRFTLFGKEWVNTAVLALFNAMGPLVLVIWQYSTFFSTGYLTDQLGGIFSIWLFPTLVLLPVAAIISRKLYRETNNPYIGGIIMALVVALISSSNTLVTTF